MVKVTYTTTAGYIGGSITTVIPSQLSKLLKIEKGDKIKWEVDIGDKEIIVILTPQKEEKE